MDIKKKLTKKSPAAAPYVVVRAYSGVFFGRLLARRVTAAGAEADLADVRQVWQWTSAGLAKPVLTCGDLAIRGVGRGSKVSDPAPAATISDVKAFWTCTPEAVRVLSEIL